jgi:hypothetical protein
MHRKRSWRLALLAGAALGMFVSVPTSASAAPPTATTEAATAVRYEEATLKGSVNPEGSATSYWFEYGETASYGTQVPVSPESVGAGTLSVLVSELVAGLKESTTYHFRIVAESEKGTSDGEDTVFTTAGFNFSFANEGSGNGQLKQPELGIATDSEGNIWIADTGNNRVEKFNSEGEFLSQFGKEGAGNGEFKSPKGIAIGPSDSIWVVDSGNDRVEKFNAKGEYLLKFGEQGTGKGQFESPSGIASDFQGRIWVVDSGNDRVEKFNKQGEYQDQAGETGTGPGQLSNPTGITASEAQKILILDTGNNRVESWTVKAEPPEIIAKRATEITASSAILNASIDPEALPTSYWFEYGTTTAYGNQVPTSPESIGSGKSLVDVDQTATGLTKGTLYHFRAVAESSAGVVYGEDKTFQLVPPKATTEPAKGIEATQATLKGTVNPEGSATVYWFEYGKVETKGYEAEIPIPAESVGSGFSGVVVTQTPFGLEKNTGYKFRVVAENEGGTTYGTEKTFKTPAS